MKKSSTREKKNNQYKSEQRESKATSRKGKTRKRRSKTAGRKGKTGKRRSKTAGRKGKTGKRRIQKTNSTTSTKNVGNDERAKKSIINSFVCVIN